MQRSHFLRRLIGIAGFGSFQLQAIIPKRKIYLEQFFVAGFRHYQGMNLLEFMQPNDLLELRREPDNEHDDCAIALYWQQEKIGYVPATINSILSRLLDANALPLVGTITHLNKEVKPWESVAVAIFFLQDQSITNSNTTTYLQQLEEPIYQTKIKKKKKRRDLFAEIFEQGKGIVSIDEIETPDIKNYFANAAKTKFPKVMYKNKLYHNITTDDIYTYMYDVVALHPIVAEDGTEYILFQFANDFTRSLQT
jgi:hypothetical protein